MNREQWTKKVERMVADIEAGKTPASVQELYIFGSYARGARECKDLDLVIIHALPSPELMAELKKNAKGSTFDRLVAPLRRFDSLMRQALRRPGEDMDIFLGRDFATALQGRIIDKSELRLIWSRTDRDWRGKLTAIPINADAKSAPRNQFVSPKLAQAREEDIDRITTLLNEHVLTLTRVAIASLEIEELSEYWTEHFQRQRWGKKLQSLLPFAFAWIGGQEVESLDTREHGELWDPQRRVRVQLGRLNLYWMFRLFQEQAQIQTQCLIPLFRQAYSKELFVFERGPAWPSSTDPWDLT